MRKLAMLSTALLCLGSMNPSFAQPGNSAPQPGLPPGAGVGAANAQPPLRTGNVATTPTGMQPAPMASGAPTASETPVATPSRRVIRRRRRAARRRAVHHARAAAPATTSAPQ